MNEFSYLGVTVTELDYYDSTGGVYTSLMLSLFSL